MNIVLIGTGHTAHILGKKLYAAGHAIVQVFGRNAEAAASLANLLGSKAVSDWEKVNADADIIILAVSDAAIEECFLRLPETGSLVVHTAGAVSKDILKNATQFGVLYPLQSLRKEMDPLTNIPLLVDAGDENSLQKLVQLAKDISPAVQIATDEQRLTLHVAAVFCNNFSNYLLTLAEEFCRKENMPFDTLMPLIRETGERLKVLSPAQAQTGPAMRNDQPTINKHRELLKNFPEQLEVYNFMTEKIMQHRFG